MSIWDLFSGKQESGGGALRGMDQFLADQEAKGDTLFGTVRSDGGRIALALGPLVRHRNKYQDEVEDGAAVIFVEGATALAEGEWFQGPSAYLSCDQGKAVEVDPFTSGSCYRGSLNFSQVDRGAPFHEAYGLTWWSSADGSVLRTLLDARTKPESRLIWHRLGAGLGWRNGLEEGQVVAPLAGIWSRSHHVEGRVVPDSSEGSGFSVEGEENWSEELIVWDDGEVAAVGERDYHGRLEDGVIRWEKPESGDAAAGERSSKAHFRPYDGPVESGREALVVGGYSFLRMPEGGE